MAIIPANSKRLILDFDGVMTHLNVDWDAVRSQLAVALKQPDNTPVSAEHQYAQNTNHTSIYNDTVKRFETKALAAATISPLLKEIVSTRTNFSVVSNSLHSTIVSYNQMHQLTALCLQIVAADDVTNLKPDPEGLLKIVGTSDPGNFIYMGDQPNDELAANQAKISFMHYEF